jgi:hypothetical protein
MDLMDHLVKKSTRWDSALRPAKCCNVIDNDEPSPNNLSGAFDVGTNYVISDPPSACRPIRVKPEGPN